MIVNILIIRPVQNVQKTELQHFSGCQRFINVAIQNYAEAVNVVVVVQRSV